MITFENAENKTIDFTRVERCFCKCYVCKEATTIDFEVRGWRFPWFNSSLDRTILEPRVDYFRDGAHVKSTYIAECPRCGAPAERLKRSRLKTKKHSEKHECDDRCQRATSEKCECSCEGFGHGIKNKLEGSLF
jgi:hypothetical protein